MFLPETIVCLLKSKLWRRWKDKNAILDVSTSPHCWPTHVTSLPNENEATRFWILTPTDKTCILQVSCGESFWAVWTAGPTGEAVGPCWVELTELPLLYLVYPSHWRRRWTIGTRCQFYFLEDGPPLDLKAVQQTDLRLSIFYFVQTKRSLFLNSGIS